MTDRDLFLCMGSACHQLGVYEVLPRLQALIEAYQLEDCVTLKGSFCLEICSHGITMKFRDCHIQDISPQNVDEKFAAEILPLIRAATA